MVSSDDRSVGTKFTFTEESEQVPASNITLVDGASFVICDASGDIRPRTVQGLFIGDTRICSELILTLDGQHPEPLSVSMISPFQAAFVSRTQDRDLLLIREIHVSGGMRMDLRIENLTHRTRELSIHLAVGADLADLFAVKEGRAQGISVVEEVQVDNLTFADDDEHRGLRLRTFSGQTGPGVTWVVQLAPREVWKSCVELSAIRGGEEVESRFSCKAEPAETLPQQRQADWQARIPQIATDIPHLSKAFAQASEDLGALRLFNASPPGHPLIAAGAPWFMTLFGRDSIFTAWMSLLLTPTIALNTARALARLQGQHDIPATEEQPGRILHEVRFSSGVSLALRDGQVYYGTADATPLFVMLVHQLWMWGVPMSELVDLFPAVDAALDWISSYGDQDGDGYIEYSRQSEESLINQGWKDSFDGVSFADGRLPEGPIALAEVQGYAYAAWRAGQELAAASGDYVKASFRSAKAEVLQTQFEKDFWIPEIGAYALALDGNKSQVDAIASNMGHLLWSGIVRHNEHAAAVARWLVSPEMFSGWGVRTLATSMARYNPLSYHNGSVWPHDTAIAVAGLRRAGYTKEALQIASGLLAATSSTNGRLPELFAGLGSDIVSSPVPYPASCSPQAWAAASPLLMVRSFLGLQPDFPKGTITLNPVLPQGAEYLKLVDLPLGNHKITIEVEGDALAVRGLPPGITLLRRSE